MAQTICTGSDICWHSMSLKLGFSQASKQAKKDLSGINST